MDVIKDVQPAVRGFDDINEFVDGAPYFILAFKNKVDEFETDMGVQLGNGMQTEENMDLLARALFSVAQEL